MQNGARLAAAADVAAALRQKNDRFVLPADAPAALASEEAAVLVTEGRAGKMGTWESDQLCETDLFLKAAKDSGFIKGITIESQLSSPGQDLKCRLNRMKTARVDAAQRTPLARW